MKREYRIFPGCEIRAAGDGNSIEGYAAVFGQQSEDLGGFRETVRSGAFKRALQAKQDVRALFNHDSNMVLGRLSSGTLQLSEDERGLKFRVELPDTQAARDLKTLIARGDITQCSFGFCAVGQEWDNDATPAQRTLTDVDLFDVSPVTFPAYPQTSLGLRSMWPDGEPEDVAEHRDGKTKRVDGEDLPASAFLIVLDPDKTDTWNLPVKFSTEAKTKSHIQNALSRFSELKDVPQPDKDKAWKELVALAKKHGIHVSDENSNDEFAETRARMMAWAALVAEF